MIFFFFLCLQLMNGALNLYASEVLIDPMPVNIIINPCKHYSLINSIDFDSKKNLCCATFTHGNLVVLYKINAAGQPKMVQYFKNPSSLLSEPQHAVFSPNGEKIVVVNWTNQTLTIYQRGKNDFFSEIPIAIIPSSNLLIDHKPHGMAFSPFGDFLAIAYGASNNYGRAIALFQMIQEGTNCELVSVLKEEEIPGVPKGIAFSPDGTCLLVTFSDTNSLVIYDLAKKNHAILPIPRQVIQGEETRISRPEDVKISPDGNYCAVTNSDQHTVTFYSFDKMTNCITQSKPNYVLQNPEAQSSFPHGIAFSPDGSFVLITQFGPINASSDGGVFWDQDMKSDQAKINVYKSFFMRTESSMR